MALQCSRLSMPSFKPAKHSEVLLVVAFSGALFAGCLHASTRSSAMLSSNGIGIELSAVTKTKDKLVRTNVEIEESIVLPGFASMFTIVGLTINSSECVRHYEATYLANSRRN